MRIGPILAGLGAGAKSLRESNAEDEARQAKKDELARRRLLEEAVRERQAQQDARQAALDAAQAKSRTLEDALRQRTLDTPVNPPAPEPLERVIGGDGKPVLMPRSKASGRQPYIQPRSTAGAERERASERRAARARVDATRREMHGVLRARPKESQYLDRMTFRPDTVAMNEALGNWRSDSTETADAVKSAQAELSSLLPVEPGAGTQPPQKPVEVRDAELKAEGKKAAERLAILKAEGYNVQ